MQVLRGERQGNVMIKKDQGWASGSSSAAEIGMGCRSHRGGWPKAAACQTICGNAEGLTSDTLSSVSGVKPPLAGMGLFNIDGMIVAAAMGGCGGMAVVTSA